VVLRSDRVLVLDCQAEDADGGSGVFLGAIQNFASAAHFSFPVDTVEKEKQKWGIKARKFGS